MQRCSAIKDRQADKRHVAVDRKLATSERQVSDRSERTGVFSSRVTVIAVATLIFSDHWPVVVGKQSSQITQFTRPGRAPRALTTFRHVYSEQQSFTEEAKRCRDKDAPAPQDQLATIEANIFKQTYGMIALKNYERA